MDWLEYMCNHHLDRRPKLFYTITMHKTCLSSAFDRHSVVRLPFHIQHHAMRDGLRDRVRHLLCYSEGYWLFNLAAG
jgi:hypothetical protein